MGIKVIRRLSYYRFRLDFHVTCPVCEKTIDTLARYADGVKHLIEAHLQNHLDYFPYKCCIGNCAFGAFGEKLMITHLGKVHKIKYAERPVSTPF